MLVHRMLMLGAICAATAGCAIHPLPENITGNTTYQIVAKVRCEARDAVRQAAIDLVLRDDAPLHIRKIGEMLKNNPSLIKNFNYNRLDPKTKMYVEKYDGTAIAYQFTIDITESNVLGGGVKLGYPFATGTSKIGIGVGTDRTRENTRSFIMTDTFGDLMNKVDDAYCAFPRGGENFAYPMTGSIGMAEVVNTFISINELGTLTAAEKGKAPIFADTLEFITKLSGSVNPTIEFSPLNSFRWNVVDA